MIFGILLLNMMACESQAVQYQSVLSLEKQFTASELPVEYRPTMRYWWLGGAVTHKQLFREMSDIRDKGFGVPEAANTAHITGRDVIAVEIESARRSNVIKEQKRLAFKYMAQGGNKFEMKNFYSSPLEAKEPWQVGTSIQYFDDGPRFKTLTDFVTRSCMSLRSGRHVANVCTFGNRWRWRGNWRTDTALVSLLSENGYLSDRFTNRALNNYAQFQDGFLVSGSGRYSVMIFDPGKAIPLQWLKSVEKLIHEGLTVVAVSEPVEVLTYKDHEKQNEALRRLFAELFPTTITNQAYSVGKGKTYRIAKEELPMLLRNTLKITPQAEWIGDGPISWQHREGKDYDLFFLLNSGPETLGGKILLRATGRVELWNADTGKIEPLDSEAYDLSRTSVHLRLQPDEGYFLVVRSNKDSR